MTTWTPHLPPPKPPAARLHCRHYSYDLGMQGRGPGCAAGRDQSCGVAQCMPSPTEACAAREEWTGQERAAWDAWRVEHHERMVVIMQAIPQEGNQGVLDCPGCGAGQVRWTRAPSNRHLHAGCTTPDCFRIMQ